MSYRQKERMKEMIVLPVWAMICLCLPSVFFTVCCIVAICQERESFKDKLRAEFEAELSPIERHFRSGEEAVERKNAMKEEEYIPVCPRGYDNCIWDPARIKHNNPNWYERLYGDLPPEKAILVPNGCMDRFNRDPNEEYYCWDDEEE